MSYLSGEVEKIVYRNPTNDWTVMLVDRGGGLGISTVVGYTGCTSGQSIECEGEWRDNKPYGEQFIADTVAASFPTTEEGLVGYLSSGVLPGIGPAIAKAMVKKYGMTLLTVLDENPERLSEIRGIGPVKAASIAVHWRAQTAIREIMLFLHSQGISAALCKRIHSVLGDKAVALIRANPYRLCTDVRGIGFSTADTIATGLGIPKSSEQRIVAGMYTQMDDMTKIGHCGSLQDVFLAACTELLDLPIERVSEVLEIQLDPASDVPRRMFVRHDGTLYPLRLAQAEETIARTLLAKIAAGVPCKLADVEKAIQEASDECAMKLAVKQAQAIRNALNHPISILTGGPGCGKTAALLVLLAACRKLDLKVKLAAPTGKAAQRAMEATGCEAQTIHRLLGIKGFGAVESTEFVDADILVIDEMSMVDVPLMREVITSVAEHTSLVMVGDVDQLPSVGPGQVLGNLIESGVVPVTVLDEVFRQAAGSDIITNAHKINKGLMPSCSGRDGDFFLLTEETDGAIAKSLGAPRDTRPAAVADVVALRIEELVSKRLPAKYGFDPVRDIQVLSPMNKGSCGVQALNERLQGCINPKPDHYIMRGKARFGIGDKVIQCRNNYSLDIFNGDVGIIESVSHFDDTDHIMVRFDGKVVQIPLSDTQDLALAYAMTIHKSQGSQAPAIVVPVVSQHWNMLQRNLFYTAITRASQLVVVVGETRSIAACVDTVQSTRRITRLRSLLERQATPRLSAAVVDIATRRKAG